MFDSEKQPGSNWPQRTPTLNIEWGQIDPKVTGGLIEQTCWSAIFTTSISDSIAVFQGRSCRRSYPRRPPAEGHGSGICFNKSKCCPWSVSFTPMDLIVHTWDTILSLRRVQVLAVKSEKGGIGICFQIGSNSFFFFLVFAFPPKTCLTAMDFSNGNLASWVLTRDCSPDT